MKRILISLYVTIFILLLIPISAHAETTSNYIIDNLDVLSVEENNKLNSLAEEDYRNYSIKVIFYIIASDNNLDASQIYHSIAGDNEGIMLYVRQSNTGAKWTMYRTDSLVDVFDDKVCEELAEAYNSPPSYYEGIEDYLGLAHSIIAQKFTFSSSIASPVSASKSTTFSTTSIYFSFYRLALSVLLGIVISSIIMLIMKSSMKSVHACEDASNYVDTNSLCLTRKTDSYSHSEVDKKPRPKNKDN